MSVKSEVSSNYLNAMKRQHGRKPYPEHRRILMTGDGKPGSIGQAIHEELKSRDEVLGVVSYHADLTVADSRHPISGDFLHYTDLVMCHGASHLDWFEDAPLDRLRYLVDINLTGTIAMVQAFVRATIDTPVRKSIVGIGSMAYNRVLNGSAVYCASKAGHAMLMRCLAWELAPKGYDVYCVHPSNTLDTPMSEETIKGLMRYRNLDINGATAYWNDSMIREQSLTKEEIARVVAGCVSGDTPYLSGAMLELAGGQR